MTAQPTVLVTGASTGIGYAICEVLLAAGYRVCGSLRNAQDAEVTQQKLGPHFHPLLIDVKDAASIAAATTDLQQLLQGQRLAALINNAGVAVPGPLAHLPIADLQHQLDVNVLGVLRMTQACLPLLGMDKAMQGPPGRIINISSVSGALGFPFVGAYVASKHALEGMSKSLRIELIPYGIEVVVIGPGSVATPIWQKSQQQDLSLYAHTDYAAALQTMRQHVAANEKNGMPASRIGQLVLRVLRAATPRARYTVVGNLLTDWLILHWLPTRPLARIIANKLGLTKIK